MQIKGAKELGLNLNPKQNEQFFLYLKELLKWNENINLTSITSEDEIITKHFLDSLTLIKAFDPSKASTFLDIGSGAGFPGIPLKIAFPHLKVTLVDSVKKKANFMKHIIDILKLEDIKAIFCRSEDLPKDLKESFDIVTSRAVADIRILSEYCLPFVKLNGSFIAYKGSEIDGELEASKNAILTLGGKTETIVRFNLPNTDIIRTLIVIRKIEKTPANFPRRAGIAKKRPL